MDYPISLESLDGRILGVGNVHGNRRRDLNLVINKGTLARVRVRLLVMVVVSGSSKLLAEELEPFEAIEIT